MSDQVFGDDFDDTDETQQRKSGGGGGIKRVLFILVPILLLVGIAAALYFTGALNSIIGGQSGPAKEAAKPVAAASAAAKPAAPKGQAQTSSTTPAEGETTGVTEFVELPNMLVNLISTEPRKPQFLRLKLSLELASANDKKVVETMKPRIMDNVQTYMRELNATSLQGSAGLYRLREELKLRINKAVAPVVVRDVLFQEMLVQ